MSIKLSRRLSTAAELVPKGAAVIDVGTDHAKLPVWLIQNHIASHAWASDINPGPLASARQLIEAENLQNMIQLRLTDGLHGFTASDGDTVIICGMGGDLIVKILTEAECFYAGTTIVLCPHTKPQLCRRWLDDNGFDIKREQLIKDNGRIYPIFTASAGQPIPHTELELYTGRLSQIKDNPLFTEYLDLLIRRFFSAAPYNDHDMAMYQEMIRLKGKLELCQQ